MANKPLLLALLLACSSTALGQTYTMTGAPIASCNGTFFDSGGSSSDYSNNQNLHTTICPDGMGGSHILLQFDSTVLAPGDVLCILDGSTVLAPVLACASDFPAGQPFQIQASANNPGGCLTVTFVSDAAGTSAGWSAGISCSSPCILPAPGNVQVADMTGGNMTWTWDAVPGSTGFDVSVNGGAWQPASGAQSHTVGGLVPGDLVVIEIRPVSANPGCAVTSITANKTYVECTLTASVASLTPALCPGTATGSAVVGTSGATGAIQFFIVGNPLPFTTGNFTNVFSAGAHQVAVHDTAGCRDTVSFVITEPLPIDIQITVTDAECFADNSGSIQATASGGTGMLTYAWQRCQGGMTMPGPIAIDLFAGCYAVTITDANGCTAIAQDTIGEPPKFDFISSQDSVRCFGGMNGRATVFASGAVPPYTYKWGNGDTANTADSLKAGFHSVTVTDAIGCQAVTLVQVLQPTQLILDSIRTTPIACFGGANGTATVFAHGGVVPYSFLWSNSQATPTATGLGTGTHTVTLTDRNGCTVTGSTALNAPPQLAVSLTLSQNETCAGACDGQLLLTFSGGTAPYVVLWNNPSLPPDETAPQNLCPGSYTATVTDANGCTQTATTAIVAATALDIQFAATAPLCAGDQNGSLTASGSGGALPYQFQWSIGAAGGSLQNLACGIYTVTLTDAAGCTRVGRDTLPCPAAILIDSIAPTPIACFGGANGSITVFAHGGTGMLMYAWSAPNLPPGPIAPNLAAGIYTVTVSDANGCSVTATANVTQPSALLVSATASVVSCFGGNDGSVKASATGGTLPYQYAWSVPAATPEVTGLLAGTYSLTVTDANGCTAMPPPVVVAQPGSPVQVTAAQTRRACVGSNDGAAEATAVGGNGPPFTFVWSNNANGPVASALGVGTYTVTAADAKGCTVTQTVAIAEWDSIRINVAFVLPSCNGLKDGQAAVNQVSGGAGNGSFSNYSFVWSIPDVGDTLYVNGLAGGQTYTLTVTDQTGCSRVFAYFLDDQPPIVPIVQATNISCFGLGNGAAQVVSVQSQQPIAQYRWSTGAIGQTLNNLQAGTYTATVTSTLGCTGTAVATISEPPELLAGLGFQPLVCNNDSNGVVRALPQGGTPGYTFSWNTGASTDSLSNLGPGLYAVTVTDQNGCTAADSMALSQPNPPELTVQTTEPQCFGYQNGLARVLVIGGAGPYRYSLDGQDYVGAGTFFGLPAGTFTARVLDGLGCITAATFTLNQPPAIEVQTDPDITITLGDSILLSADAVQTAGAATYLWRDALADSLYCADPPECSSVWAYPVYSNTYTVLVTDTNGCTGSASVRVDVEKPRGVYVPTGFSPNGDGNNDLLVVHGKGVQIRRVKMFRVFDRWGELLYEDFDFAVNDAQRGWNGTFRGENCQAGVYVWYAEVEYQDGFDQVVQGNTTLIR